jgi:hypothetical protein
VDATIMSKRPQPPSQSGLVGVAILFCFVAAAVGLGFDFAVRARGNFWIGAEPGGAAAIGAGAAVFSVLAARAALLILRRRPPAPIEEEGGDAGAHS